MAHFVQNLVAMATGVN